MIFLWAVTTLQLVVRSSLFIPGLVFLLVFFLTLLSTWREEGRLAWSFHGNAAWYMVWLMSLTVFKYAVIVSVY